MPKIEVFFQKRQDRFAEPKPVEFEHVANVNAPADTVENMLEYAYRWTNNIDGSWALKDEKYLRYDFGTLENTDLNDAVEVVTPLPVRMGRVMGHRSAMKGDKFVVEGVPYYVASFGFRKEGEVDEGY